MNFDDEEPDLPDSVIEESFNSKERLESGFSEPNASADKKKGKKKENQAKEGCIKWSEQKIKARNGKLLP